MAIVAYLVLTFRTPIANAWYCGVIIAALSAGVASRRKRADSEAAGWINEWLAKAESGQFAMVQITYFNSHQPVQQAKVIWERIRGLLEEDRGASLKGFIEDKVTELVDRRLPRLVNSRQRLIDYLSQKGGVIQSREAVADLGRRADQQQDLEAKRTATRNLELAQQSQMMLQRMEGLIAQTDVKIEGVLIALDNLEIRVAAYLVSDVEGNVGKEIDDVLRDVTDFEDEYNKVTTDAGG